MKRCSRCGKEWDLASLCIDCGGQLVPINQPFKRDQLTEEKGDSGGGGDGGDGSLWDSLSRFWESSTDSDSESDSDGGCDMD